MMKGMEKERQKAKLDCRSSDLRLEKDQNLGGAIVNVRYMIG